LEPEALAGAETRPGEDEEVRVVARLVLLSRRQEGGKPLWGQWANPSLPFRLGDGVVASSALSPERMRGVREQEPVVHGVGEQHGQGGPNQPDGVFAEAGRSLLS
jgi:hypothetical protein